VNNGGGSADTPEEEQPNTGRIFGIAFTDTDHSRTYNTGDELLENVPVTLMKWNESEDKYEDYAPELPGTIDTTDEDGKYNFFVPEGRYRISVPTLIDGMGITTNGEKTGNTSTVPVSGSVSDISIARGSEDEQTEEVIVGYNEPDSDVLDYTSKSFKKQIRDYDGAYVDTKDVIDFEETLEFRISFLIPAKSSANGPDPAAGFSTIEISDYIEPGLTTAAVSENVEVYVGNDKLNIGGAAQQNGRRLSYTFDPDMLERYITGKVDDSADLEVYMIVRAELEQIDGDWTKTLDDTATLTVNGNWVTDDEVSLYVAGMPPEISFTKYPLVLTQSRTPSPLTTDDLKDGVIVTDDVDNPTWEPGDEELGLFKDMEVDLNGLYEIDRANIGVYSVTYTATDRHGKTDTATRAVVITDGRYEIDVEYNDDDTDDIIIGARDFVANTEQINASQAQAQSLSYVEAYNGEGVAMTVKWTQVPDGYVRYVPQVGGTLPGDYPITWEAEGYNVTKSITATIVNSDVIYEADKNEQYSIVASNFLRNLTQAAAMVHPSLDSAVAKDNIMKAAAVRVYKLVEAAPDRAAEVIINGDSVTGEFRGVQNNYPMGYGVQGLPEVNVMAIAMVSDGLPPLLFVSTPDEVARGGEYGDDRYRKGVSANDPDGNDNGTPNNPHDDRDLDITGEVKYGVARNGVFTEGTPVRTLLTGLYKVDYLVTDDDGNTAEKLRVVVVNDGSYIVGSNNILRANSFVTKLSDVTSDPNGIRQELRFKSGAEATDGGTNKPIDLQDDAVTNTGGYSKDVGTYSVAITVADPRTDDPLATIVKNIKAKVVAADVIASAGPTPDDTAKYYIYGNNLNLMTYQAQEILAAADPDAALLRKLDAHADKVAGDGRITDATAVIEKVADANGEAKEFSSASGQYFVYVKDAGGNVRVRLQVNVTDGAAPVLTVPAVRRVPQGAGFNYMAGVTATDVEDGVITSRVIYTTPVNTNNIGAYKVTYTVTDSDGNTVSRNGIVLVGAGWVVKGGYALYAQDFAKKLSAITGTNSEAIRFAKAMAVRVADATSSDFGQYVTVRVADRGGYKKAAGNYRIKFAVSQSRSVTKTIKASISDDKPAAAPVVKPPQTPTIVVNNPPQPVPTPEPIIVEVPQPAPPVITPETTEPPVIVPPEATPLAPVEIGAWHLIDLLLVIFSLAIGFWLMVYATRRREREEEEWEENPKNDRQAGMWGQVCMILGVLSLVVLLITQDFSGRMLIADIWTILFAVILAAESIALISVTRTTEENWSAEREV
jgi:hypothetical protein